MPIHYYIMYQRNIFTSVFSFCQYSFACFTSSWFHASVNYLLYSYYIIIFIIIIYYFWKKSLSKVNFLFMHRIWLQFLCFMHRVCLGINFHTMQHYQDCSVMNTLPSFSWFDGFKSNQACLSSFWGPKKARCMRDKSR